MSRQNPCPICGKPDWCLVATDGSVAICPRTPSDRMAGSAGYIHDINPLITPNPLPLTVPEPEPCIDIDWQTGVDQAISRMENFMYEELTKQTGLSRQELQSMRVGWSIKKSAYTFPMRDHEGKTIGIRLRTPDGNKFSVKGSRSGLFFAGDPPASGQVLIAEGPTDTACLVGKGFPTVGRPSCNGGGIYLLKMLNWKHQAVLVADNDKAGRQGAAAIAKLIKDKVASVRIMTPPRGNDIKDWVVGYGASSSTIQAVIDQSRYA